MKEYTVNPCYLAHGSKTISKKFFLNKLKSFWDGIFFLTRLLTHGFTETIFFQKYLIIINFKFLSRRPGHYSNGLIKFKKES